MSAFDESAREAVRLAARFDVYTGETMIGYLRLRLDLEDWHGVMDAAADIREIEAEMRAVGAMTPTVTMMLSGHAGVSPEVMRSVLDEIAAETKRSAPGRSRGKETTK